MRSRFIGRFVGSSRGSAVDALGAGFADGAPHAGIEAELPLVGPAATVVVAGRSCGAGADAQALERLERLALAPGARRRADLASAGVTSAAGGARRALSGAFASRPGAPCPVHAGGAAGSRPALHASAAGAARARLFVDIAGAAFRLASHPRAELAEPAPVARSAAGLRSGSAPAGALFGVDLFERAIAWGPGVGPAIGTCVRRSCICCGTWRADAPRVFAVRDWASRDRALVVGGAAQSPAGPGYVTTAFHSNACARGAGRGFAFACHVLAGRVDGDGQGVVRGDVQPYSSPRQDLSAALELHVELDRASPYGREIGDPAAGAKVLPSTQRAADFARLPTSVPEPSDDGVEGSTRDVGPEIDAQLGWWGARDERDEAGERESAPARGWFGRGDHGSWSPWSWSRFRRARGTERA